MSSLVLISRSSVLTPKVTKRDPCLRKQPSLVSLRFARSVFRPCCYPSRGQESLCPLREAALLLPKAPGLVSGSPLEEWSGDSWYSRPFDQQKEPSHFRWFWCPQSPKFLLMFVKLLVSWVSSVCGSIGSCNG